MMECRSRRRRVLEPGRRGGYPACGPAVLTFDAATGEQTGQMRRWSDEPGAKDRTTGCAHARRGSVLASTGAGEGAVTLWDTTAATCLGAMFGGGASVASANPNSGRRDGNRASASFSPDDRRLVTCDSPRVGARVGRGESREDFSWRAHRGGGVADCAFSPDGAWVATASADGTARLWDPSDGRELACSETEESPASRRWRSRPPARFSPQPPKPRRRSSYTPEGTTWACCGRGNTARDEGRERCMTRATNAARWYTRGGLRW